MRLPGIAAQSGNLILDQFKLEAREARRNYKPPCASY